MDKLQSESLSFKQITGLRIESQFITKEHFTQPLTQFTTNDTSRYKVGKNMMSYRLKVINNEIELDDLNRSFNSFKVLMKKKCLQPL